MCEKKGQQITRDAELLLRQIYPKWLEDNGQPSSQAFWPWREVDDGCLSVDQATLVSAEKAYETATKPKPHGFALESAGVWGLSVSEIHGVQLSAWEDSVDATETTPPNPSHSVVEFGDMGEKAMKRAGRILKAAAISRGCLYRTAT